MAPNKMLVSVIIPVYNGEAYLAEAVESVLRQVHRPLEIIIVDDGSTDGSARVAASFTDNIHYVYQPNAGPSAARNRGLKMAEGDLIAFLSHDDIWTPDKLRVQVKYLMEHPDIQYTIARIKFFLEPGFPMPAGFRKELLEGDHIGRIPETLVVRKSLFDDIGKFNSQLTSAEDVEWFARANDHQVPMTIMPEVLLFRRIHDRNLSGKISPNHQNVLTALRLSIERKRAPDDQR